ncbi:helix-turn-helix domain-containing protein [Actinomadura spongiicola]|uniref:Helix-turn-helix domain-containing protein n=1 Tax=Actinomadura spongiicola TaxID=2303421 RepID=A0A372G7D9_9ACTN|nr:helix-turn-helix domain-containing protein [Actinomadura spongiicola]RFS81286.1 helix-turn-helix domain-containing protein [Actinomadura spongiicola]
MQITTISTDGILPQERFASWQERTGQALTRTWLQCANPYDFRAEARTVSLGDIHIGTLRHPSVNIYRPAKLIRQNDPEAYQVNLILSGKSGLRQAGRETVFGPGNLVVFDTSRPIDGWRECTGETVSGVTLQIPRRMLPLAADDVDRLTAISFSTDQGVGALFGRWLSDIVPRAEQIRLQDASSLASITVDLLATVLAQRLDGFKAESTESRQRLLRLRIDNFVRRRLSDPTLSPTTIAAAHQISVRYLHKLFSQQEMTVSAWIRHLRLEQCRRDLSSPENRARSLQAIAGRWGFVDEAHFSRAFRAAYGVSPGRYRRQALHEKGGAERRPLPETAT